MPQRILVFYPHPFYPPSAGTHRRCIEMVEGFVRLGCDVTVASAGNWPEGGDSGETIRQAEIACGGAALRIFRPSERELTAIGRAHRMAGLLKQKPSPKLLHRLSELPRWFDQQIEQTAPDALFVNYAQSDYLINHRRYASLPRIIETIDLVTLNERMWEAISANLPAPPIRADDLPEEALREDFYVRRAFTPDPAEFTVYDRYTHTIAIAEQEAEIIRQHTSRTHVVTIPMTQSPVPLENTYDGPAVLPTGGNPFNLQGLLYFIRRVLPTVRETATDFTLRVTGYCSDKVLPEIGLEMAGFVPEIRDLYRPARFMVCPVFGGTGQQVKVVEAMAHGVPVVALRAAAERSPIVDGENGLVADDAEQFARHVVTLWNDRALCRRLGTAARETIRSRHSKEQLSAALADLLRAAPSREAVRP